MIKTAIKSVLAHKLRLALTVLAIVMGVALVDTVLATEGVAEAAPSASGVAQIIAPDGTPIGGQGPPTLGLSWVDIPALNSFSIEDGNGRAPVVAGSKLYVHDVAYR